MARDRWREEIEGAFVVEREGWAFDRATRVTETLQRGVLPENRLETLVIWTDDHGAFTMPGRTVYFSRRLFELMPDDDAAAFIIAHELAHHRLGHVPERSWTALKLSIAIHLFHRVIARQEYERHADLLAIEMCVDAGYDPERCLRALEISDKIALDYGDVEASLGPEDGLPEFLKAAHPPMQERIAAVRAHVVAMRAGHRLAAEREANKARRQRRAIAVAATAIGVVAVAVLLRRRPRWPG